MGNRQLGLRRGSLRVNFSWTLLANVSISASKALVLVLIAKLSNVVAVGEFALALAIVSPVVLLFNMQLLVVLTTDQKGERELQDYIGYRVLSTAVSFLFILALQALVPGLERSRWLLLSIALWKGSEAIAEAYQGYCQQQELMSGVAKAQVVRAILYPVVVGATLSLSSELAITGVALATVSVIVLLVQDVPQARRVVRLVTRAGGAHQRLSPRIRLRTAIAIGTLSFPLGVVSLVDSLNANMGKYFLQAHYGEAEVGYFSALSYIVILAATLITALSMSFRPRLARLFGVDRPEFIRLLKVVSGIALGVGAMSVAVAGVGGRWLLSVMYAPEYGEYSSVLVWLMAGGCFWHLATCANAGLSAARQFRVQPLILLVTALVTSSACWLLVPSYGLVGAAWAVGLGFVARLMFAAIALQVLVLSPWQMTPVGDH